jgi:hypothetical protein
LKKEEKEKRTNILLTLGDRDKKKEKIETSTNDKPSINHHHALHQEKGDMMMLLDTWWKTRFGQLVLSHVPPKERERY